MLNPVDLTNEQKRSLRNQMLADALRSEVQRRAASLQSAPISATPTEPTTPDGTLPRLGGYHSQPTASLDSPLPVPTVRGNPNRALQALTDDQLVAHYTIVRRALAAPNFVPAHQRAAPSNASRTAHSILQNERVRIQRIARERKLTIDEQQINSYIHEAYLSSEREHEIETGDRVHAEYRNPHSPDRELLQGDGELVRTENGKLGTIYIVRLDSGEILQLSKSNLTRLMP